MLQENPGARLSWYKFFNHEIFSNEQNAYYARKVVKYPVGRMLESQIQINDRFDTAKTHCKDQVITYRILNPDNTYVTTTNNTYSPSPNTNANITVNKKEEKPVTESQLDQQSLSKIYDQIETGNIIKTNMDYYEYERSKCHFLAQSSIKIRSMFKKIPSHHEAKS